MNICCISHNFSVSDIILLVTAIILLYTLFEMKKGNKENARLNRLQAVENTILKQIEFHINLLKGININIESTGRGFGTLNAPVNACGQEAFEIFYDSLKNNYVTMFGNTYKNEQDIDTEEKRIQDSFIQLYKEYGNMFGNYFKIITIFKLFNHEPKLKNISEV